MKKLIKEVVLKPITLYPTKKVKSGGHFYQAETHGDILCVSFYSLGNIHYDKSFIVFVDKNNNTFAVKTLRDDGSYAMGISCLDKRIYKSNCVPINDNDNSTIMDYLKETDAFINLTPYAEDKNYTALSLLEKFQTLIRENKLKTRHKKITDVIDAHMKRVPELPSHFTQWIDEKVMSGYVYAHKEGKENVCYCTKCKGGYTQKETIPRGKEGTCSLCGAKITYKNSKVTKNLTESHIVSILQRTDKGVITRYFNAKKVYRDHYKSPEIRLYELTRHFYEGEHMGDYEFINFKQTGNIRWSQSIGAHNLYGNIIYPYNIEEEIKGTPFQYSSLYKFLGAMGAGFYLSHYLYLFSNYPVIEYIEKMGLYRLIYDIETGGSHDRIVNLSGKTPLDVLGLDKDGINQLKRINGGYAAIKWLKLFKEISYDVQDKELIFLCEKKYYEERFIKLVKYTKSVEKTATYLKEIGINNDSTWLDYLDACKCLNYDLNNKLVMYPKSLNKSHDDVMSLFEAVKNEMYDKKIKELSERLIKSYEFKDSNYVIVVPSGIDEIINEGNKLNHCVGKRGYIERMANEESYIIFVRSINDISVPLCTLEIRNNSIIQKRIQQNWDPDENVLKFLKEWEDKVLSKLKSA